MSAIQQLLAAFTGAGGSTAAGVRSLFAFWLGGGGAAKITFTDAFTGTNGDVPNARWTQVDTPWTIQGNALSYAGAAFGFIKAPCTPGDNDVTVTLPAGLAGTSYFTLALRYVDSSNYVYLQKDSANAEKLTIGQVVAGAVTAYAVEGSATTIGAGATLRIASVGTTINAYANGSLILTDTRAIVHPTAAFIALGINGPSHTADTIDDVVLA